MRSEIIYSFGQAAGFRKPPFYKRKGFLFFYFILIFVFVIYIAWQIFWPVGEQGAPKYFVITKGESVRQISGNLQKEGLLRSPFFFDAYLWLAGQRRKLQAGEYWLGPRISLYQLSDILVTGRGANLEREITILEGWNLREISQYLEYEGIIQSEELLELVGFPLIDYRWQKEFPKLKDFSQEYNFLKDKPKYVGLEGYLFPDTYRIYRKTTTEAIVRKTLNNFDEKLKPEIREKIKQQKKTIFEVIIMASILEKEVAEEEDQRLAADIFYRRLKAGMPLQADSTVNYITGKKMTQALLVDTKIDSPYNTYKYPGLPKGPISNPGIGAIKAALSPLPNNYWYFLTARDGKVIFSKTLEEHGLNKKKYL